MLSRVSRSEPQLSTWRHVQCGSVLCTQRVWSGREICRCLFHSQAGSPTSYLYPEISGYVLLRNLFYLLDTLLFFRPANRTHVTVTSHTTLNHCFIFNMAAMIHELSSTKELNGRADDAPSEPAGESDVVQISTFSFVSLMVGIGLAVFLIALDRTIIANAIPLITNEFNSPNDAGWYGSAASLEPPCYFFFFQS